MTRTMLRLGKLSVLSVAVAALLAPLTLVDASAAAKTVKPDSCPTDKPLVVDGYANLKNGFDYGADGHVWALDTFTNWVQIRHVGGDVYCLKVHSVGTSTTIGGLSPEGTGTVRAGVTAPFDGSYYARFEGNFAPTLPTSGLIGNFDYGCQPDGVTCTGQGAPGVAAAYFSKVHHIEWGAYEFTADAGPACGVWHQSSSGDTGDIVC